MAVSNGQALGPERAPQRPVIESGHFTGWGRQPPKVVESTGDGEQGTAGRMAWNGIGGKDRSVLSVWSVTPVLSSRPLIPWLFLPGFR